MQYNTVIAKGEIAGYCAFGGIQKEARRMSAELTFSQQEFSTAFYCIFHAAHRMSRQLVEENIRPGDGYLRELLAFALQNQKTSEYPYVFSYAFARSPRDLTRVTRIAASVHLLQSSTFITDDVFDFADERYYQPAIHRQYDVSHAIIAAELLQTIAMETTSSELRRPDFHNQVQVLQLLHQILKDLYIGQHLDVFHTRDLHMTVREYRRVIELGAGFFFQNLARCGALLANKPKAQVEALAACGYHYGMGAFISDDIADIARDEAATGKPFVPDLQARRMRLPFIAALEMGSNADVRWLKRFMKGSDNSRSVLVEAADRIQRTGALDICQAIANSYFSRAVRSLEHVSGSLAPWALKPLAQRLIKPAPPAVSDTAKRIAKEFRSRS